MRQKYNSWTYRRFNHKAGVETSEWLGTSSPALSAHFHDETQISVVYAGCRFFQIGRQCFEISAGQFVVIPAGSPHRSHGRGGLPTKSRDIFIDPAHFSIEDQSRVLVGSVPDVRNFDDEASIDEMLHRITLNKVSRQKMTLEKALPDELVKLVRESDLHIKKVAACSSLSREGFIRRFAREIGMTPHAYRLAYRATQARSLLRKQLPPAATAYECGFADQSHLGRVFRKNFGTTPASYRRVWQS